MPKNKLGTVRRSHIHQSGPGSIIDFRAGEKGGGPVSVIATSLDRWPYKISNPMADPCIIREERLEKKLGVEHFRLPPVEVSDLSNDENDPRLEGVRFPQWLLCPKCFLLKPQNKWQKEIGDPSRWCANCSVGGHRIFAVPSRFVVVCDKGHIDDFPWRWFLKTYSSKKITCDQVNNNCELKLKSNGKTGLSGLTLSCIKCNAFVNMGSIFSNSVFKNLNCNGSRPWIGDKVVGCKSDLRALQRGAANMYFPHRFSALSIPPWTGDEVLEIVDDTIWEMFKKTEEEAFRKDLIKNMPGRDLLEKYSDDQLYDHLLKILDYFNNPERQDLERDEYEKFIECSPSINQDFQIKNQDIDDKLSIYFRMVIKVERLREVSAQKGFSRIRPPINDEKSQSYNIAEIKTDDNIKWLPAVEVRGEGIFIALNQERINNWLFGNIEIQNRSREIEKAYLDDCKNRQITPEYEINANFILLHTLAHVLLHQISFESGYNTASLQEKIYAKFDDDSRMSGILIYTGSSDADGTLGGLSRQATKD